MTKLYQRLSGNLAGYHMSPSTPSDTAWWAANSWNNESGQEDVRQRWDVYHVLGATETAMGTNVGATNTITYGTTGVQPVSGTWTPAAVSGLNGGSCLKTVAQLVIGTTTWRTATYYSGPLVATGISNTEWTMAGRVLNATGANQAVLYGEHTGIYFDGITLTGTPTSMTLWVTFGTGPYMNGTRLGTWDNTDITTHGSLGHRIGAYSSAASSSESVATNPYRINRLLLRSLPFVQDATFASDSASSVLWYKRDQSVSDHMHQRVHVYVSQGQSVTQRGSNALIANGVGSKTETDTTAILRSESWTQNEVSALAGDTVVMEYGLQFENDTTDTRSGYACMGGGTTAGTDGDTTTSVYHGWVEFTLGGGGPQTYYKTVTQAASAVASSTRSTGKALAAVASVIFRPRGA